MTLTRIAAIVLVALGSWAGVTQDEKRNLSGSWLLVAPAEVAVQPPGQEETITQTATTIVFGHPSEGGRHQLTCGLDGQWRDSNIAGMRLSCRGSWENGKLVLVERNVSLPTASGAPSERTKIMHIDENGSLVTEIKPPIQNLPGGPGKFVSRKR